MRAMMMRRRRRRRMRRRKRANWWDGQTPLAKVCQGSKGLVKASLFEEF